MKLYTCTVGKKVMTRFRSLWNYKIQEFMAESFSRFRSLWSNSGAYGSDSGSYGSDSGSYGKKPHIESGTLTKNYPK